MSSAIIDTHICKYICKISIENMIILLLILIFPHAEAQSPSIQSDTPPTSLKVNLGVVIAILSLFVILAMVLLYFSKFCHVSPSPRDQENLDENLNPEYSRFSGIDKTVIESLPFFTFSSLRGSKEGLDCAVCLSKFEDIEVLRLLPKCKHAFHINCIDQWLAQHSTCPLCRNKVSADDLELLTFSKSNSLRFSRNLSELHENSGLEIRVEREESRRGSTRFHFGRSFRRFERGEKEENRTKRVDSRNGKVMHKLNHKIVVSDLVFRNRWSNVSSSDLMFLESEMLRSTSSKRFSWLGIDNGSIETTKNQAEIKMKSVSTYKVDETRESRVLNSNERRSMSEIAIHTRFYEFENKNDLGDSFVSKNETIVKEERRKTMWLPIAKKTVEWFVDREKRSQYSHNRRPSLNV